MFVILLPRLFHHLNENVQLEAMKNDLPYKLKKYSEGELSLKEQLELSQQLADEKNSIAEGILREDWENHLKSRIKSNYDLKSILDKVHHRIRLNEDKKSVKTGWQYSFQRIAAILFVPMLLSFMAYFYFQTKQISETLSYAEIQCPLGVRTKFQLPDGSTGFLNSGAHLKYPVRFKNDERIVELTGEAFFDVVHNKKSPFHVNTQNLDIKVLGTTFNVIANNDEKTEEIVLQTGKVDVSSRDGNQLAMLLPNEQLVLNTNNMSIEKNEVEASQYTTWKEGKLVFRNEGMEQVARRLSRWYNAEVIIDDQKLDIYTFHATFIDEPLDEVLKLLSLTTPISYEEGKRASSTDGVYKKRRITLKINQSKINKFK